MVANSSKLHPNHIISIIKDILTEGKSWKITHVLSVGISFYDIGEKGSDISNNNNSTDTDTDTDNATLRYILKECGITDPFIKVLTSFPPPPPPTTTTTTPTPTPTTTPTSPPANLPPPSPPYTLIGASAIGYSTQVGNSLLLPKHYILSEMLCIESTPSRFSIQDAPIFVGGYYPAIRRLIARFPRNPSSFLSFNIRETLKYYKANSPDETQTLQSSCIDMHFRLERVEK